MDFPVAVNVPMSAVPLYGPHELLRWVNANLQSGYTHMEQLETGAPLCQLMHILFPPLIDLPRVQFICTDQEVWRQNYSLLQQVFDEVGVCRYIPVNEFIKKKEAEFLTFLRWFRVFFEKNKGRHLNFASSRLPITKSVTRNIKDDPSGPVDPEDDKYNLKVNILKRNEVLSNDKNQQDFKVKAEPNFAEDIPNILNKPENKPLQVLKEEKTEKCWEDTSPINHMVLKSAKDDANVSNPPFLSLPPQPEPANCNHYLSTPQVHHSDLVKKDNLGQSNVSLIVSLPKIDKYLQQLRTNKTAHVASSNCNTNTDSNILTVSTNSLNQVSPQPPNLLVTQSALLSNMNASDVILISDTEEDPVEAEKLIVENDNHKPPMSTRPTNYTISQKLREVCSKTPYCIYADMGLELDHTSCTVLIGYFDRMSGVSIVQKLDMFRIDQLSNGKQPQTVVTKLTANVAADLLTALIKRHKLPPDNLKVFYCNIPDPEVNRMIVVKLKELSPHVVSLGGLACMVGEACQIGLLECYSHLLDMINDIHYFRLPEGLTEANYNILIPISLQYSSVIMVIQYMSHNWQKLEDYFKALKEDVGASRRLRILNKFQEHKVRLDFYFLSHALDAFQNFQELQKNKTSDMVMELHTTAILIHVYASSIFTTASAIQFVRKKDLQMLSSERDLLKMSCVNVGIRARRYLLSLSFTDLGEEDRNTFLSQSLRFYRTTLKILVESLPGKLSPLSMKSIGTLLKHPQSLKSQEISGVQLVELGCQLGVCKTDLSNSLLASEYVNYIQKANDWRDSREGESVGLRWQKVLGSLREFPFLFKLVLTLLAFPRSLQLKHIFQSQWKGPPPKAPMHRNNLKRRYHLHRPEKADDSSSDDDHTPPHRPRLFAVRPGPKRPMASEDSDYTDNSSDVVDVTEDFKLAAKQKGAKLTVSNGVALGAEKLDCLPEAKKPDHLPEAKKPDRLPEAKKPDRLPEAKKPDRLPEAKTPDRLPEAKTPDRLPEAKKPDPLPEAKKPDRLPEAKKPDRLPEAKKPDHLPEAKKPDRLPEAKKPDPLPEAKKPDRLPEAKKPVPETVLVLSKEEDWSQVKQPAAKVANPATAQRKQGELVLINLEASFSWPAVTVPSLEDQQEPDMKKVEWYGHSMTSEVSVEYLRPFSDFSKYFSQNTFATDALYKEAVFLALREASARCHREFLATIDNKEEILVEMLNWAFGGFKPMGPKGFAPAVLDGKKSTVVQGKIKPEDLPQVSVSLYKLPIEIPKKLPAPAFSEKTVKKKIKPVWKGKAPKKKRTYLQDFSEDNDISPDFVPTKKRPYNKVDHSNKCSGRSVYKQPDQKQRESIIQRIMALDLDIEGFCLCCGTEDTVIFHPLFKGSLCLECKNNFTETLYRYDEDGYQSYCTICCYGMEVILCGNDSCCRSYCADCLNILVSEGTFEFLKDLDPWICYLCQAEQTHGALTPRPDWSIRVQELFANNSAMEFVSH